jgi:hypothetical protein
MVTILSHWECKPKQYRPSQNGMEINHQGNKQQQMLVRMQG